MKTDDQVEKIEETHKSFSALTLEHITRLGIAKSEFCRRTLLSEKTYERIAYGHLADRPKSETVMQVCVGLALSVDESEALFNAAGYHLGGCRLHEAYRALLANGPYTVYGCNSALRSLGLPPLARYLETC